MNKYPLAASLSLVFSMSALAVPGDEWSFQGSMEMMGMKMPISDVKICLQPGQAMTPPMEGKCTFTNVTTEGNTTKFNFSCSGSDAGKGSGSTTVTGSTLVSTYTLETPDGSGTVNLNGKKGGACDTSASPSINGKSLESVKPKTK